VLSAENAGFQPYKCFPMPKVEGKSRKSKIKDWKTQKMEANMDCFSCFNIIPSTAITLPTGAT